MSVLICAPHSSSSDRLDLVPTVGVEEEFLLLRADGEVACVAPEVLAALDGNPRVKPEFMRFQVESTSGVCQDLGTLAAELTGQRRLIAEVAAGLGVLLVASGTPPLDVPGAPLITDNPRYRRLSEHFAAIAGDEVCCGCHVHVAVPSRETGVAVVNRIRRWLPVLLALTGNSPMWRGRDTGWDSYRFLVQREWPTAVIPPACPDVATYDSHVSQLIAAGDALDQPSVYFFARLSPRYPTVEIRIADTCLTVAESVLVAALCRALVATALTDVRSDRPYLGVPDRVLAASSLAAARRGLDAVLVDPLTGEPAPGREVLRRLLRHVAPALDVAADRAVVTELLGRRLRRGSAAARQRALATGVCREHWVRRLAEASVGDV